jgi:hypothetical protein
MTDALINGVAYSLPALVVFLTVYFLFSRYLQQQLRMEGLKLQKDHAKDILPIRLQSYERLIMLCERMSVDQLMLRLIHPDMGVKELRQAMLIAIQQEFEHNLSQQVYVSENLWKIIKVAKEQMQTIISAADGTSTAGFMENLHAKIADLKAEPVSFAVAAIRNEASLLM